MTRRIGCPRCGGPLLPSSAESLVRCDRDCGFAEQEAVQLAADRAELAARGDDAVFVRTLEPHERAILRASGAGVVVVARATATVVQRGAHVHRWYAGIERDQLPGISDRGAA